VAAISSHRRKWPLDLGREPVVGAPRGADRDRVGSVAGDGPATLAFCGSHCSAIAGAPGLIDSGLAAAAVVWRALVAT
jgi:hypothetical protein